MFTLFERVIYTGAEDGVKISVHVIQSLMSELFSQRLSFNEVSEILGLTDTQAIDFAHILSEAQKATNPQGFGAKVFAYLILANNVNRGNGNRLSYYLIEANFWSMVQSEAGK